MQRLLKSQNWQEADRLTERLFEQILGTRDWYQIYDRNLLRKIPCKDLRTIDQLWTCASKGYYGFSVQKRIYLGCGGTLDASYPGDAVWYQFCKRVGWRIDDSWVEYRQIQWHSRSTPGHLPLWRVAGGGLEWVWRGVGIFPHIHQCDL